MRVSENAALSQENAALSQETGRDPTGLITVSENGTLPETAMRPETREI
jgi:hypothetical protein